MKYAIICIIPLYLFASGSFITPIEYASQLYKNPRGIGCQKCHGDDGKGKLIAKYMHKNKEKSFSGPNIKNMGYADLFRAMNKRKNGMPRYFLTDSEIQALYLYLHKDDTKIKNKKKNVK